MSIFDKATNWALFLLAAMAATALIVISPFLPQLQLPLFQQPTFQWRKVTISCPLNAKSEVAKRVQRGLAEHERWAEGIEGWMVESCTAVIMVAIRK